MTAHLHVSTKPIVALDDLFGALPATAPLSWVRRGEGMVGAGIALDIATSGPGRFAEAAGVLRAARAVAHIRDEVARPGTGLVAFGSFAFSPDSAQTSHLIVPEVVLGHRGDAWWATTIHLASTCPGVQACGDLPALDAVPFGPVPEARHVASRLTPDEWREAVAAAVRIITSDGLDKVVLARDEQARASSPWDQRRVLHDLAAAYPTCWTFAVAGLVGATPELLVRTSKGLATSRVLAGTIRRLGDDRENLARAASLARSSKDLEEHEYAVASVAAALGRYCTQVAVPEAPYVLHLPNVMHLATDVSGVLAGGADQPLTSLDLAGALHPSAAVCGTPTERAAQVLAELEHLDRGRYAGPVGWMGADGDGEWGIALRCAAISDDGRQATLYAGGGIVAGSVPVDELAETEAKFLPMRRALGLA